MSHASQASSEGRKVFSAMADEHDDALAVARQCLDELRERCGSDGPRLVSRALRVITALRVSAKYAGLGPLYEVSYECEHMLSVAEQTSATLSTAQLDALLGALEFLRGEVRSRRTGGAPGSAARARGTVRALRDATAGALAIAVDGDDLALFSDDGIRLVNECRRAVLKGAETDGGEQRAWIDAAFRAAHTLKGNSGLMGLAALESAGRAAEQALDGLRSGDVVFTTALTIALVSLFERTLEGLKAPLNFTWDEEAKQLEQGMVEARSVARRTRLGELLVERNLVSPEQIELVLAIRRAPLGEALVRMQALSEQDLSHTLELQKRIRQGEQVEASPQRSTEGGGAELVERSRIARARELVSAVLSGAAHERATGLGAQLEALCTEVWTLDHVSVEPVVRKARQACADTARRLGKTVELLVEGEDALAPRAAVETLSDAVLHLVRNSVDHGVEGRDERLRKGKPSQAQLRLSIRGDARGVCVEVRDDGRGLDRGRIVARAVAQGLLAADAADRLDDGQVFELVFTPGFSTAEVVSDVSGRGVGMDVVQSGVAKHGGRVRIASTPNVGTCVTLLIPGCLRESESGSERA
jgi:chemotaxis protein histidine kinase CheA